MTEKERYSPQQIESAWQARWEADGLYRSRVDWSKPKHYALTMLPYPSGDLHIGHWFAMTPSDARARFKRMQGYNVLFPMGFDAFGLPAENAAIQRGIHPAEWTYANIERMRGQLRSMGAMFDWEREIVSCDPEYYRWTEWFFKLFYEHDLAYRGEALVNWSDALQTVLANEQVINGRDERLGQPVIQKLMTQWFFRYTRYAEELLNFENLDWPEPVKIMQTNWIGRSEGARVFFQTEAGDPIEVFTTRPDTLWGATFMVLAPEHPLVDKLTTPEQRPAVEAYQARAAEQTEIERTAEGREKTGVFTGGYAINPATGARIPVWIADYVMITYGTGAIMGVPSGDQRDFEFARKFGLEVIPVVQPDGAEPLDGATMTAAYEGAGTMINSGPLNGLISNGEKGRKNPAIAAAIDWIVAQGCGREAVNYRLRDWLISRQRYWGAPIPIIYTQDGQIETVPEEQLPVELPRDVQMQGAIGNPLLNHPTFIHTVDSQGRPARRETDTMDTFMCSSWYHLRYLSPHYDKAPFDPEEAAYWLPVDTYTGGAEHATMHLLYTRWFNKALRDLGVFDDAARIMAEHGRDPETAFDEPMLQLRNQGQILGEERTGDVILAVGTRQGSRLIARHVRVVHPSEPYTDAFDPLTPARAALETVSEADAIAGEIVKRTENILNVRHVDGQIYPVEVAEEAQIEIPHIPGPNSVNQLKHHLEIQRMSKSKGNVVNPDELVAQYGADTVRAYLMFRFDWAKGGPWDSQNIAGVTRWLNDVWEIVTGDVPTQATGSADRAVVRRAHQAIIKVTESLENFSFNTAVAELMSLRNELRAALREQALGAAAWEEAVRILLLLMAPFTPHIAEELWARRGWPYSIHTQAWPQADPVKAAEDETTLVVMKNGKPIDHVTVPVDIGEADAIAAALASAGAVRVLNGGQPKKVIFIPGRQDGATRLEPKVNIVV